MGQGASDHVPSPPPYPPPAGNPSTSSGIVVASRSGGILPLADPPPSEPTNGVSVATVLDPIQGLLDCYVRGRIPNPNTWLYPRFLAARPVGRTIFGFLHLADNCRTPYRAETASRAQHDDGSSNCQVELTTWQHLCILPRGCAIGYAGDCDDPSNDAPR